MRQLTHAVAALPLAAGALLLLSACSADGPTLVPASDRVWADTGAWETPEDADADGVADTSDCAPQDPYVFPGADEICNDGVDNDCDGLIDASDPGCG